MNSNPYIETKDSQDFIKRTHTKKERNQLLESYTNKNSNRIKDFGIIRDKQNFNDEEKKETKII